jgi:hypothetical protein
MTDQKKRTTYAGRPYTEHDESLAKKADEAYAHRVYDGFRYCDSVAAAGFIEGFKAAARIGVTASESQAAADEFVETDAYMHKIR